MGSGPEPTVVVDDLHVVYRVYGAGGDKGTAATALMRVIKRQRRPSVRDSLGWSYPSTANPRLRAVPAMMLTA